MSPDGGFHAGTKYGVCVSPTSDGDGSDTYDARSGSKNMFNNGMFSKNHLNVGMISPGKKSPTRSNLKKIREGTGSYSFNYRPVKKES